MPNIVLEAIDADVIKTYVRLGLGIGIVAEIAMREEPQGGDLVPRPVGHLFGQNVARIAFKRGAYLRNFVYAFAEMLSDRLSRPLVERAMAGDAARLPAMRRRVTSFDPARRRPDARASTSRLPPGRHDHLHRDVGAGAAARRGQPRPGLPRLRLRPAPARRGRRGDARRPQPVPADGRRAGAARARSPPRSRRCTATATTRRPRSRSPPARPRRSSPPSWRSSHPGDEVIVLDPCYDSYEPEHRARRRPRGARAAAPGSFAPDFERDRRRARRRAPARSSSTRRTTRAAPSGRRTTCARLAALLRPTDVVRHQRRGLRAHGLRRASTRARRAIPSWRRAASSSRASARPTTSPAGRSATPPRRRR